MANQHPSPLFVVFTLALLSLASLLPTTQAADSPPELISLSCSEINASDVAGTAANVAAVLADMHRNVSAASYFARAERNTYPAVYGIFQCREYLSPAGCLACFAAAAARLRNQCPSSEGATVFYDGCFLRYENDYVYDVYTTLGRFGRCEDRVASSGEAPAAFNATAQRIISELAAAVPATARYYAAARRTVEGGAAVIYGVAQCLLTLTPAQCTNCLRLAYVNIQGCPPAAGATAVDVGCFMRYSDVAFFNESQVVDLGRFIRTVGEQV